MKPQNEFKLLIGVCEITLYNLILHLFRLFWPSYIQANPTKKKRYMQKY